MAAAGEGLRARLVPRCIKCRERDAAALVNQTEALCALCLRGALLGKFKSAVNGGKLIAKDDHVLLAFSGGAASRCALDFLLAIQSPFLDSQGAAPSARKARQRGGAFRSASLWATWTRARALLALALALAVAVAVTVVVALAYRVGCSKIVVGTTVTRMAARVIAATAKAQGFSLPTDLAVFDCRRPVPVLRPLRDCCQRDLALLAHLLRLQTVFLPSLATQASLRSSCPPGRRRGSGGAGQRLGRGASMRWRHRSWRLQPFPFNRAPSLAPPSPSTADSPPLPLCAICLSPLPPPAHTPPTPSQPLSSAPSAPLCCSCRCGVMGEVGDGREGGRARGEERKEDGQEEAEGGGGRAEEGRAGEGKGCRELRSERAVEQLVGLPAAFLARGRGGSASYTEWLRQAERSMIADCLLEGQ
ncbi:hypothetical protein CLOM_g7854 [Closterium sp. NIES-68]|nr:hypothetical protein CLOM_g7854 [Closterium sp. NIES-68]